MLSHVPPSKPKTPVCVMSTSSGESNGCKRGTNNTVIRLNLSFLRDIRIGLHVTLQPFVITMCPLPQGNQLSGLGFLNEDGL